MRNILITGGSRGIGAACVREFSDERVFMIYNKNEEKALKLCSETGAISVKCDVSNAHEVQSAADFIHSRYGGIDVLINNAGISQIKMFTDISENDWDNIFDVNIKGMYLVTHAFIKDMINKKYGKIVNVSSMWGITGGSCEVHYSASKAAVIGFTKALAKEMGLSGINVNCVAPGVIDTDMNGELTDEDFEVLKEETPLNRIGTPEEAAKLIHFLASDDAAFITGEVVKIDGGI